MESFSKDSVEALVLKVLQRGSILSTELIKKISTFRLGITKQGVYRVLRKLKNEERIVLHGKSVSLNVQWIQSMNEFFSLAQFYYSPRMGQSDSFLNVQEKDKIVYFFRNLKLLDAFWNHALFMFSEALSPKHPLFVYNPHEWFAYAREETEHRLLKMLSQSKRQALVTATHDDPLDRELRRRFTEKNVTQYHIRSKSLTKKDNYYFNVLENYLIEVFIDEKISKQLDEFYNKTKTINDHVKEELVAIISKRGKHKLIISRNQKKAEKYKRALSKHFFISRSV